MNMIEHSGAPVIVLYDRKTYRHSWKIVKAFDLKYRDSLRHYVPTYLANLKTHPAWHNAQAAILVQAAPDQSVESETRCPMTETYK